MAKGRRGVGIKDVRGVGRSLRGSATPRFGVIQKSIGSSLANLEVEEVHWIGILRSPLGLLAEKGSWDSGGMSGSQHGWALLSSLG